MASQRSKCTRATSLTARSEPVSAPRNSRSSGDAKDQAIINLTLQVSQAHAAEAAWEVRLQKQWALLQGMARRRVLSSVTASEDTIKHYTRVR